MPKFSIVVPVYSEETTNHYRGKTIRRLVDSILNQTFTDFELLLVDDGSPDPTIQPTLQEYANKDDRVKVIYQENQQRAVARNNGMGQATGDWICWADSDDQYTRDYLWVVNESIKQYPEYSIFFFGALIKWKDALQVRHAFELEEEGDGHVFFRSGHINTGSFVFHRGLLDYPEHWIPNASSPYQFAAESRVDLRYAADTPDIEEPAGAFTDGKMRVGLSLGNPWGDDWLQVYLLTRHYKAKSIDIPIYIIYPRGTEDD
jgi:glycosyltransferase involved in cell wall biosynthesis